MFRSTRHTHPPLEATLRALPSSVTVYIVGGTYFVVAETGLFVIAENSIDLRAASVAAAVEADRLRGLLSDQVPFVPFIDAVAVGDESGESLPSLVVSHDLVLSTILSGPRVIDAATLDTLRLLGYPVLH